MPIPSSASVTIATAPAGLDTASPHRVFISGPERGIFGIVKRELRRRSAIEASLAT
jgi:hypothetical protein